MSAKSAMERVAISFRWYQGHVNQGNTHYPRKAHRKTDEIKHKVLDEGWGEEINTTIYFRDEMFNYYNFFSP